MAIFRIQMLIVLITILVFLRTLCRIHCRDSSAFSKITVEVSSVLPYLAVALIDVSGVFFFFFFFFFAVINPGDFLIVIHRLRYRNNSVVVGVFFRFNYI
jgi:hypothetical protein